MKLGSNITPKNEMETPIKGFTKFLHRAALLSSPTQKATSRIGNSIQLPADLMQHKTKNTKNVAKYAQNPR